MALKPWYKVAVPREDLREDRPLDSSEFAVHLDDVRDGRAPDVYKVPEAFFARTYLTESLLKLAGEVVRRLSGEKTETSSVFNMATQFGGGKTHALTLLYHLARLGTQAGSLPGVPRILKQAGVASVPEAATAIFVGTEFDSLTGRGGDDGTPLRRTPWGEIAYQMGGDQGFAMVAQHDEQGVAPAGDVIRRLLPTDRPCLILLDELMNFVSRNRKSGMATQLYGFLHNLSEVVRGSDRAVLVVSIPASELEMTAEDIADYDRFKKLLSRLGKAVVMSAGAETSEIIRRRLFEWDPNAVSSDGRVLLNNEAEETCREYADWVIDLRAQLPAWFPVDGGVDAFKATYPFHPMVLSVFERKWQELPNFQQTRGVLRLLALWVARAYKSGYGGDHRDPLIGLGTAPLDDPLFRAAVFEQLGESRLEGAVTTDICGKSDSIAVRLDNEAVDTVKKARLHRKVATTVFFESNGGQQSKEATGPEIRLATAGPDVDIGNVETTLEALGESCHYLDVKGNKYRFSLQPNLNRLFADRWASVRAADVEERVKAVIQSVFTATGGLEVRFFPEESGQVPDRAALTLAVLAPTHTADDRATKILLEEMTRQCGTKGRTYKSGLLWAVADSAANLNDEARKLLTWTAIRDEDQSRLNDDQKVTLRESLVRAEKDLRESVWRTYRHVMLLGEDNAMDSTDLGLITSSAAPSLVTLIVNNLVQGDIITHGISPAFLVGHWPPAFKEWSTKGVRDAFYASPAFPRLLNVECVKDGIARGVARGDFAYVGKSPDGGYNPFEFGTSLSPIEIDISDEMYLIKRDVAEAWQAAQTRSSPPPTESGNAETAVVDLGLRPAPAVEPDSGSHWVPPAGTKGLGWRGDIPPQKWMNFYRRVLTPFATDKSLKVNISFTVDPDGGIPEDKLEALRAALRDLGLPDDVKAS